MCLLLLVNTAQFKRVRHHYERDQKKTKQKDSPIGWNALDVCQFIIKCLISSQLKYIFYELSMVGVFKPMICLRCISKFHISSTFMIHTFFIPTILKKLGKVDFLFKYSYNLFILFKYNWLRCGLVFLVYWYIFELKKE